MTRYTRNLEPRKAANIRKLVADIRQSVEQLDQQTFKRISKVLKVVHNPERRPTAANRLKQLWNIREEDVQLDKDIVCDFELWKQQPATFLSDRGNFTPVNLAEHYHYALTLRASLVTKKILWRFVTTAYHKVLSALSGSRKGAFDNEGLDYLTAAISRALSCENGEVYDNGEIRENLKEWATEGGKYWRVAFGLGCVGCYFFFPNLAESM
jgi:hypothetical protein